MIDSVLKGTGNSRFLKSAVPAGTSWADALAMLQAGTFPIDFNGINTEGFQQVGTPLNKANLLKDATALTLGLTGDVVPNDMFNALAHAGDLHVWRKTVVTKEPVPAGYTLGAETNTKLCYMYYTDGMSVLYASSVSIDDAGNVSLVSPSSISLNSQDVNNVAITKGKFVKFTATNSSNIATPGVYFIPTDATFTYVMSGTSANQGLYCDKAQKVNAYPLTPAGTTTTYPVSTNRNAYQDGNDAKPAGYTLGEVVTGSFSIPASSSKGVILFHADTGAISVSTDGILSIGTQGISLTSNDTLPTILRGRFVQVHPAYCQYAGAPFNDGGVYYLPADAVFSGSRTDRYQPVTGYAAIPANTTIEYLGCLGDKARVQVVSYVGMGTYGEKNPCSISVDFPMKAILFIAKTYAYSSGDRLAPFFASTNYANDIRSVPVDRVPTVYTNHFGLGDVFQAALYGRRSEDCKSYYWYNESDPAYQGNTANSIYYFLVIG